METTSTLRAACVHGCGRFASPDSEACGKCRSMRTCPNCSALTDTVTACKYGCRDCRRKVDLALRLLNSKPNPNPDPADNARRIAYYAHCVQATGSVDYLP